MSCPDWDAHLLKVIRRTGLRSTARKGKTGKRTCILVVELQEVALLVQLVGVAVEKGEDGLQLRDGIVADVHDGRLKGLYHGQRTPGVASVAALGAVRDGTDGRVYGRGRVDRGV